MIGRVLSVANRTTLTHTSPLPKHRTATPLCVCVIFCFLSQSEYLSLLSDSLTPHTTLSIQLCPSFRLPFPCFSLLVALLQINVHFQFVIHNLSLFCHSASQPVFNCCCHTLRVGELGPEYSFDFTFIKHIHTASDSHDYILHSWHSYIKGIHPITMSLPGH